MTPQDTRHPQHGRAIAALVFLTTVWGSTFVVLQSSLELISPLLMMALRFGLSAALLSLLSPAAARRGFALIVPLLPLSLAMFAGFALQLFGLHDTTPARSAFLTSLSVLLVPAVEWFATRTPPGLRLLSAVGLATAGVAVLFHPIGLDWRPGDTLTLLCAFAFAWYIVELGVQSRRHGALELVIGQFTTIGILAGIGTLTLETPHFVSQPATWMALAYLGLACTVMTFLLMTWAQARVRPIEAGVIYTLEPVVAAAFSVALGRELFEAKLVVGGALVLVAMVVASVAPTVARSLRRDCGSRGRVPAGDASEAPGISRSRDRS